MTFYLDIRGNDGQCIRTLPDIDFERARKPLGPQVFFDFPPNLHVFEEEEDVWVGYRIEDLAGDISGRVLLNGQHVIDIWNGQGSISMNAVELERGVVYNFTIVIVNERAEHTTAASLLFMANKENKITKPCFQDPTQCVMVDDLEVEEEEGLGEDGAREGEADFFGLDLLLNLHLMPLRRRRSISMHQSSDSGLPRMPDFSHFLRAEHRELVLFDDFGPGLISRIFIPLLDAPNGSGPSWRVRMRVDGETFLDETFETLTSLSLPPFSHPLAGYGDPSLGFLSMVPILFRHRCTVSLAVPPPYDAQQIFQDSARCLEEETICSTKVKLYERRLDNAPSLASLPLLFLVLSLCLTLSSHRSTGM